MKIRRIAIKNFRNFRELDVELAANAVIVGANGVGKTNLLHALRLVLDPSLPDSARQLRFEDFWDGIGQPHVNATVEVSVDLAGFDDNDAQLAQDFAAKLLDEGIYVIGFSFPVVPRGQARIRVQLSAAHEEEHIHKAVDAFTKIGRELNVI